MSGQFPAPMAQCRPLGWETPDQKLSRAPNSYKFVTLAGFPTDPSTVSVDCHNRASQAASCPGDAMDNR